MADKIKIQCVYKITTTINDKIYIGSAVNFKGRVRVHLCDLRKNNHHSSKLQHHFNKYGVESLEFSILEIVEQKENLTDREQYYLDTMPHFFNNRDIAENNLGVKYSQEVIDKIKEARKRQPISQKAIDAMREANLNREYPKGYKQSDEHRLKQSIRMIENHPMKNKKHKPESRKKMSESAMGRIPWNKGKQASKETRQKQRDAKLNKKASEETRLKMSISHKARFANKKEGNLS